MRSALAETDARKAGRSRWWVAGLSSFLALAVVAALWVVLRDEEYVAPSPGSSGSGIRPAAAAAALQELGDAISAGEEEVAVDLAQPGSVRAVRQLRGVVRNARRIPVREVSLRYLGELGGQDDRGEWAAAASMSWRFGAGGESESEIEVRFGATGGDVSIVALGGNHGRSPVWLGEPLRVRRGPRTLVIAGERAAYYDRLARRAVDVVTRVVPGWSSRLVVEVPRTARALDRALGASAGSFDAIAGVTAVPDGAEEAAAHVFLNPERLATLRSRGAQVVVSHEAAHVALEATSTSADLPVWLTEGLADYVALRDVPLPLTTTASQIIEQVSREGPPAALPDEQDFDEGSDYFGAAYEASWIACRMLADRAGERRLLRFYRQAAGAAPFDRLFRETFGVGLQTFTRQWRRTLSGMAA